MHFRGEDPVGKRIRLINDGNIPGAPRFNAATIVGVAPTIRQRGFSAIPILSCTSPTDRTPSWR